MAAYSRCTLLAEKEDPGKSKLYNTWSYLLANYTDKEGNLLEDLWSAEDIIKQALYEITSDEIKLMLLKEETAATPTPAPRHEQ